MDYRLSYVSVKVSMKTEIEEIDAKTDVYSLVSGKMREAINKIPRELLNIEEKDLLKLYTPSNNDRLLRIGFWNEYTRATRSDGKILAYKFVSPIMSMDAFYEHVVKNLHRMAFMLIPPQNYKLQMQNLLDISLGRLFEILTMPLNEKTVNTILKAALTIRDVQKGAAVQRTVNVNASLEDAEGIMSTDDYDKKIEDAKMYLKKLEKKDIIEIEDTSGKENQEQVKDN